MPNSDDKMGGLAVHSIDKANTALIDADNVFWAMTAKNAEGAPFIPRQVLSLYQKQKESLDEEMRQFRFSASFRRCILIPLTAVIPTALIAMSRLRCVK